MTSEFFPAGKIGLGVDCLGFLDAEIEEPVHCFIVCIAGAEDVGETGSDGFVEPEFTFFLRSVVVEEGGFDEFFEDGEVVGIGEEDFGIVFGESSSKKAESESGGLRLRGEDLVAPFDGGANVGVARRILGCGAADRFKGGVDAGEYLGRCTDDDPGGGELDGEGKPIEAAAEFDDGLRVLRGDGEIGIGLDGLLFEELDCTCGADGFEA